MAERNISRYTEIGRKIRTIVPDKFSPAYEWEELVQRMCASQDANLRAIGSKEREELKCRH